MEKNIALNSRKIKFQSIHHVVGWLEYKFHLLIQSHTLEVICVAISSDNKYIATGGYDKIIRLWNIRENYQECALIGHTDVVECIIIKKDN